MIYDIIISLPLAPAFTENIANAIALVIDSGGESPTISANPSRTPETPLPAEYNPMHGTKADNGRAMLHFRMPARYTESELITFLQSVMTNPIPPITVKSIRSRDKIIEIDSGDVEIPNTFDYETLVTPDKSSFLKYMADVRDGTFDGEGNPNMRPVNMSDDLYLSCYAGVDPIALQ